MGRCRGGPCVRRGLVSGCDESGRDKLGPYALGEITWACVVSTCDEWVDVGADLVSALTVF